MASTVKNGIACLRKVNRRIVHMKRQVLLKKCLSSICVSLLFVFYFSLVKSCKVWEGKKYKKHTRDERNICGRQRGPEEFMGRGEKGLFRPFRG